jgi:hypothetical protein
MRCAVRNSGGVVYAPNSRVRVRSCRQAGLGEFAPGHAHAPLLPSEQPVANQLSLTRAREKERDGARFRGRRLAREACQRYHVPYLVRSAFGATQYEIRLDRGDLPSCANGHSFGDLSFFRGNRSILANWDLAKEDSSRLFCVPLALSIRTTYRTVHATINSKDQRTSTRLPPSSVVLFTMTSANCKRPLDGQQQHSTPQPCLVDEIVARSQRDEG